MKVAESRKLLKACIEVSVVAILAFSSLNAAALPADHPTLQGQLKLYALHNNPNSADISPDEQLVVTESSSSNLSARSGSGASTEVVQLWNFKENKLRAEFHVPRAEGKTFRRTYFRNLYPAMNARFVRFSPDGSMVLALVDQKIYVLGAQDLEEFRTIPLRAPPSTANNVRGRTITNEPHVASMEISPDAKVVAVLWVRELLYGEVQLYDFSSGKLVQSWETPQGWVGFSKDMAWSPNAKLLLVPIPNNFPCASPSNLPDVFAFDVQTGTIDKKLTTGLLTRSIGMSAEGSVLADDSDCLGVLTNHHPKLRIFDLATGKRLGEIAGRGAGVRYLVSVSADGSRFLAFTGKIKAKFDWGDFVPQDAVVDETFSVWNLKNYQEIVTSQNIPGLLASGLRISSNGRYAVSYGQASFVYELPR